MNGGRFGSPSRTQGMSDVLDAVISVETGFKKLVAYERPLRSLLALFAWITIVQRPVRLVGWLAVAMFLQLRDALKGDADAPPLARAPFTLHSWAASTIMGVPLPAPSQVDDAAARTFARGEAHRAATATFLARERRKANEKRVEKKKEQAKKEALAKPKPLKSFRSMNPLAPLFRPVQRFLLSVVRRQRTVRALLRGRDDPVATATAAMACLVDAHPDRLDQGRVALRRSTPGCCQIQVQVPVETVRLRAPPEVRLQVRRRARRGALGRGPAGADGPPRRRAAEP